MPRFPAFLVSAATLAYPFAVYFALGKVDPLWLGLGLAALALMKAWATRAKVWLFAALAGGAVALVSALGGGWTPVKMYPVLVSVAFLAVFALSVLWPPTVIERIARLAEPSLAPRAVAYTRSVTLVWCAFFVCNGAIALATGLWASDELWLFYNGFLSYVLMGAIFACEWLVRRRVRAAIEADGAAAHV